MNWRTKPRQKINVQVVHRPTGLNEERDCVIRAYVNATGADYSETLARAKELGRRARSATKFDVMGKLYGSIPTFTVQPRRPTVARFLRENQSGVFIVHIRNHVFAVRDGVVLDSFVPNSRATVDFYWKF